jgi:hypothetical protein
LKSAFAIMLEKPVSKAAKANPSF